MNNKIGLNLPPAQPYYLELLRSQKEIYEQYYSVLLQVEAYTKQRKVFDACIDLLPAVKAKLQQARSFAIVIENILERLTNHLVKVSFDEQDVITQFSLLKTLYKTQLLQNMDHLLCLMGARGFMRDNAICEVWEKLHAELF